MTKSDIERKMKRFHKKSERFLKTDVQYILSGSFWLSVSNATNIGMGLLLAIAFANLLSPQTYGNYQFILSLVGIISAFTLTGMETSVKQAAARGVKNVLYDGFFTRLKWSWGVFVLTGLGSLYYFINDNNTLAISLLLAGSLTPFLESAKLYNSYLHGTKQFKRGAILGILRKFIPAVLMLVTVWLTDDPVLLVLVFFSSNTIVMLSLFFTSLPKREVKTVEDREEMKSMVNYSKHLSLMNFLGTVAGNLDKILIFHFLGAAPLAAYAFALMPVSKMKVISNILKSLLLPKLSVIELPVLKKTLPRKIILSTIAIIAVVAVYIAIAPFIFKTFFPQYQDAAVFSQFLSLVMLLSIPNTFFGQTKIAHEKKK